MVDTRVREIGDVHGYGLARARGGLVRVESEQHGFESGLRLPERDAGEVESRD